MNVFILNDTSTQNHAGCRTVMKILRSVLSDKKVVGTHRVGTVDLDDAAFASADAVVANGEGTMHGRKATVRFILEKLGEAQRAGKKTLLVNSVWQNCGSRFARVVRGLDLFTVREPLSAGAARDECGRRPLVFPDLSISDPVDLSVSSESSPVFGCAGASPGAFKEHFQRVRADGKTPHVFLSPKYTIGRHAGRLVNATYYVTGQHHGVYTAALAGCPFIAIPSNTHKIEGVLKWSGLDISVCGNWSEVQREIRKSNDPEWRSKFSKFSRWLKSLPRLDAKVINEVLEN